MFFYKNISLKIFISYALLFNIRHNWLNCVWYKKAATKAYDCLITALIQTKILFYYQFSTHFATTHHIQTAGQLLRCQNSMLLGGFGS